MEYYYTDQNNQTHGPVSIDQLRAITNSGALNSSSMICAVGNQQWSPITTIIPTVAPPAGTNTEPLAIWSFVMSLLGLICCGVFLAIPAVVCGHMALSNIKKRPQLGGKGLAIAGLIIGYVGGVFWLLYLMFFGGMALLQGISEGMGK